MPQPDRNNPKERERGTIQMQTPTIRRSHRKRWAQLVGGGATALVALAAVAAPADAASTPSQPTGASGSVAALGASSMEVQNATTGQTTVGWTGSTQFSKTVTEAVSSLAAGDCVSVSGTASKKSKTTITARTITVTTPTSSGSCTASLGARTAGGSAGGGFFGGRRRRTGAGGGRSFGEGGGSGTRPSFPGGGSGANNFRKQLATLSVASGKVTGVSGSTVSVSGASCRWATLPATVRRARARQSRRSR